MLVKEEEKERKNVREKDGMKGREQRMKKQFDYRAAVENPIEQFALV